MMEKFPNYQESKEEYEFFDYHKERQELFNYSKSIAEYLRSENIANLIIIDRSSRPLYVGVKEYFKNKYPHESMPNIYFMNPKGFKPREDLTREEIQKILEDCTWKEDAEEKSDQVRSREEIRQEFEVTYKELMADKNKPSLVFDTCIHSGGSLGPVKKALDNSGFSDVRIGAVNPSDKDSKIKTDFYITTERPEKGCYPFDRDRIIEKTFNHVYSQKTKDPKKRDQSIRLRKEIKRIINEFLSE